MKQFSLIGILLFGTVILMNSCKQEQLFPDEPMLVFKEYKYNGLDTLKTIFSFTDGDGDIGVAPTGNDYNMLLTLYYKDANGNFQPALYPASTDTIKYPYRIPELPDGQNGLEGDIHLIVNTTMISYDTIQFDAYIVDQTNHKSSVIRTPEFGLH
jgi:hypothetical protein